MNIERFFKTFMISTVVIHLVLQITFILMGRDFIFVHLTNDDSYYYFQAAWNFRELGFPTFDGIHSTNGVQFLWYWLVVGLSFIVPDKLSLVRSALFVCVFLNTGGFLAILLSRKYIQNYFILLLTAVSWFFVTLRWPYFLTAMEISLHGILFWWLLYLLIKFSVEIKSCHARLILRQTYLITFVISLLVWTRLDSAIFAVFIFIFLVWKVYTSKKIQERFTLFITINALIAALMSLILFTGNLWMGGTPIPVSGLIKQASIYDLGVRSFPWFVRSILRGFRLTYPIEGWRLLLQQPDGYFPFLADQQTSLIVFICSFLLIVFFLAGFKSVQRPILFNTGKKNQHSASDLYLVLGISTLIFHVYFSGFGTSGQYFVWYLAPVFIFSSITGSLIIDRMVRLLPSSFRGDIRYLSLGFVISLVAGLTYGSHAYLRQPLQQSWDDNRQFVRIEAAEWVAANIPQESICASWNAGLLGFLTPQPLINLDGLANSFEYYKEILSEGEADQRTKVNAMMAYLDRLDVSCVIDINDAIPAFIKARFERIAVFPLNRAAESLSIEVYSR